MDWLTGSAYWPFKDFSTPVRPENPGSLCQSERGGRKRPYSQRDLLRFPILLDQETDDTYLRTYMAYTLGKSR